MTTFGTMPDGRPVASHVLTNSNGIAATILTWGGTLQSLRLPAGDAGNIDIVLGFADLDGYLRDTAHHGALIGRFANRIADGRFSLDGREYHLPQNSGGNTLHGGPDGFDRAIWKVERADGASIVLSHLSADGDAGFPGNMTVSATYTLSQANILRLAYEARCDAPTVVNLTNHSYWNLGDSDDVLDHVLRVNAQAYTPVNPRKIPTGEVRNVAGTPFDFRSPTALRARVQDASDPQIAIAGGIDHNFVLDGTGGIVHAATVSNETCVMEVWTTEPGMQVYTGNNLGKGASGKHGAPYPRWSAIALETQHFPNSPNEPSFPTTVLRPGEVFRSATEFRFRF